MTSITEGHQEDVRQHLLWMMQLVLILTRSRRGDEPIPNGSFCPICLHKLHGILWHTDTTVSMQSGSPWPASQLCFKTGVRWSKRVPWSFGVGKRIVCDCCQLPLKLTRFYTAAFHIFLDLQLPLYITAIDTSLHVRHLHWVFKSICNEEILWAICSKHKERRGLK